MYGFYLCSYAGNDSDNVLELRYDNDHSTWIAVSRNGNPASWKRLHKIRPVLCE